ncbi:ribonuclease H-like domain-containing protein, partial [Tanacetum coccineum]
LTGSKWVYKIKYKSDGEVERYKARVVAKGFGQKEGLDYEEIFSLVVKMSTVRCFINMAVQKSWNILQMDVNNAFLYGDLTKDVYMIPPPGSKAVEQKLVETLTKAGFLQRNNNDEISKFKSFLNQKFKIKDLGELIFFLGIEVLKIRNGLCLNQRKYCIELLHEYGLLACKHVATPMPENGILSHKETENDKLLKNITSYQKIVGKLIYLCNTRPDIAYSVHCLSQHMHSPLQSHFKAALRVLRYLKSAPGAEGQFLGIVFLFVVVWSLGRVNQATLSRSSAEAEYRSMASAVCEVMWIVKVLKDLNFSSNILAALFCDNSYAIQIAANPVMHEKTKHFDIDVHLIREKVASVMFGQIFKVALGLDFAMAHGLENSRDSPTRVPCLRKITHKRQGISLLQRIGVGVDISIFTMLVAAIIETERRDLAHSEQTLGVQKGKGTISSMSGYWLIFQLTIAGFSEGFAIIGFVEFFYKQFPENTKGFAGPFVLWVRDVKLFKQFLDKDRS